MAQKQRQTLTELFIGIDAAKSSRGKIRFKAGDFHECCSKQAYIVAFVWYCVKSIEKVEYFMSVRLSRFLCLATVITTEQQECCYQKPCSIAQYHVTICYEGRGNPLRDQR